MQNMEQKITYIKMLRYVATTPAIIGLYKEKEEIGVC